MTTSINCMLVFQSSLFKPLESGGKKFQTRRNNKHWTPPEVNKLVKGVSEYGVGNWTMVKKSYFKRSFRKPPQLKVMILVWR